MSVVFKPGDLASDSTCAVRKMMQEQYGTNVFLILRETTPEDYVRYFYMRSNITEDWLRRSLENKFYKSYLTVLIDTQVTLTSRNAIFLLCRVK